MAANEFVDSAKTIYVKAILGSNPAEHRSFSVSEQHGKSSLWRGGVCSNQQKSLTVVRWCEEIKIKRKLFGERNK